jgi:hypothetical protein
MEISPSNIMQIKNNKMDVPTNSTAKSNVLASWYAVRITPNSPPKIPLIISTYDSLITSLQDLS